MEDNPITISNVSYKKEGINPLFQVTKVTQKNNQKVKKDDKKC